MPAPSWKGYLRISLVTVPLRAYSASDAGPAISFNQLHSTCHSRIQYRKVCPIHGEVPKEEIVSGYEYAKGQYAVIEPEEIDVLRTESDKWIRSCPPKPLTRYISLGPGTTWCQTGLSASDRTPNPGRACR